MTTRPTADASGRRAWIAAGLVIAAFASYGAVRSASASAEDDGVVVTGEFRADGTCSAAVDGQPISGDTSIVTHEVYTPPHGVPPGYAVDFLQCELSARMPDVGREYRSTIDLSIARKHGSGLPSGGYRVLPESLEQGDTTAAEASLGPLLAGPENTILRGREGNVRIVRVDSSGVVASFRIVAHPYRSRTGS
jgi:hypothetical protein